MITFKTNRATAMPIDAGSMVAWYKTAFTDTLINISIISEAYLFNNRAKPAAISTMATRAIVFEAERAVQYPIASSGGGGGSIKWKNLLRPKNSKNKAKTILMTNRILEFIGK